MNLSQSKLTKEEWCALEVPVEPKEKMIIKLIYDSWKNTNLIYNHTKSLLSYIKSEGEQKEFDKYFYQHYFKKIIDKLCKKFNFNWKPTIKKSQIKLKKKDEIRINNFKKTLDTVKDDIFEFILLKITKQFLSSESKKEYYYLILKKLLCRNIIKKNTIVVEFINYTLDLFKNRLSFNKILKKAAEYIEQNKYLDKYIDIKLYPHQKQIIREFKSNETGKLVLYQAPTGTGKTLTPIALSRGKKVIFVCAAKHIGLQLAKSCVSLEIPIAVAFGCEDADDIRLHYYSAIDYKRNFKTGGIFRVDNSVGDKVEIIISDIQSYLPAMNYMLAFNRKEDLLWYWDEPTITLDYEEHEYHEILKKNWFQNKIENIVLSSATLPNIDEITLMTHSYNYKYPNNQVKEIKSYACKKSIPLISKDGYAVLPHLVFSEYSILKQSLQHLEKNKTIMRHFSVEDIAKFILYVNKNSLVQDRYKIENYFENIEDLKIEKLKEYYLVLLKKCKKNYSDIYNYFSEHKKKRYSSTIKITTSDSHTLTDGPTIYITNDVKKVAKVFLQSSRISSSEINKINEIIDKNERWKQQLEKLEMEDAQKREQENGDDRKDNKYNRDSEMKTGEKFRKMIDSIRAKIQTVELNPEFVPNKIEHLMKWTNKEEKTNEFTSDIDDEIVEEIMMLDVVAAWKILLLMGIGVFSNNPNIKYMEIMKKLATEQKLYLIIASSDYIYGTNYQFCHGYIGKNVSNLTQEKMIQAFGRIGRKSTRMDYTIRLRDDSLINKLLLKEENKIEVRNLNKLFSVE